MENIPAQDTTSAIAALSRSLSDCDNLVRLSTVEALNEMGGQTTIPILIQALADKNYEVRMRAVEGLGNLEAKIAVPKLQQLLLEDSDELVQIAAAEALGKVGARAAVPGLKMALGHRRTLIRMSAAVALGEIGEPSVISYLQSCLDSERRTIVKIGIYEALFRLGRVDAIHHIVKALKNNGYRVRCAAANTIAQLSDDENREYLISQLQIAHKKEPTAAAASSIKNSLEAICQ